MIEETRQSDPAEMRALILSRPGDEEQVVTFIKRSTKKERRMVLQTEPPEEWVKEHGAKEPSDRKGDPAKHDFQTVWDLEKGGFRSVPLDSVLEVEQGGVVVYRARRALNGVVL